MMLECVRIRYDHELCGYYAEYVLDEKTIIISVFDGCAIDALHCLKELYDSLCEYCEY